jgi:hypothetical protein
MKWVLPLCVVSLFACDRESSRGNASEKAAPFVPAQPPSAFTKKGRAGCLIGRHRCSGELLEACDDIQGWQRVNTCMSAAHCNAALQQCLVDPCILGEKQCNGSWLEECQANGWRSIEDCKQPDRCNAQSGKCD